MIAWLCGDGPALFGCVRCGRCLEHCSCRGQDPVPGHILTKSAQEVIARRRREQRQTELAQDRGDLELLDEPPPGEDQ